MIAQTECAHRRKQRNAGVEGEVGRHGLRKGAVRDDGRRVSTEATCNLPAGGKERRCSPGSLPRSLALPRSIASSVSMPSRKAITSSSWGREPPCSSGSVWRSRTRRSRRLPFDSFGPAPAGAGPVYTPTPAALISVSPRYGAEVRKRPVARGSPTDHLVQGERDALIAGTRMPDTCTARPARNACAPARSPRKSMPGAREPSFGLSARLIGKTEASGRPVARSRGRRERNPRLDVRPKVYVRRSGRQRWQHQQRLVGQGAGYVAAAHRDS